MKRVSIKNFLALAVILGTVDSLNADQVILDDLIVQSSICVGVDCINPETFGFDTLLLKENNLRIKFDDTSVTGTFPYNDWQITINDSANGGLNKFSIDDVTGGKTPFTIAAGAGTHALYVDSTSKIGLGTDTPATSIHMKKGDTPTVRLEQDGSSGWAPYIWDVAGNESNFFIRDSTNGSLLPFRIFPNSPTDSLRIEQTGVKIGANLTVGADLTVTGNIISRGSIFNASDRNLKENIIKVDDSKVLEKIENLDISFWNYKVENKNTRHIGPMAQDFYKIFSIGINNKIISSLDAAAVAISGVKALNEKLKEKDKIIVDLKKQIETLKMLETRMGKIEDYMKKTAIFKVFPNEKRASKSTDDEESAKNTPILKVSSKEKRVLSTDNGR